MERALWPLTGKNSELQEPPKARRSSSEIITIGDLPYKIDLDVSKVKTELNTDWEGNSGWLCLPESADLPDIESNN